MNRRTHYGWVILATAGIYMAIEVTKRHFIVQYPTPLMHLASVAVETAVAVAAALAAVTGMAAYRQQTARAEKLARLVGTAVGSSVVVDDALADIRHQTDALQHGGQLPQPEVARRAAEIEAQTERIQRTVHALEELPSMTRVENWL
jgi:hypothetical protein